MGQVSGTWTMADLLLGSHCQLGEGNKNDKNDNKNTILNKTKIQKVSNKRK